jgi:hypothetical protein
MRNNHAALIPALFCLGLAFLALQCSNPTMTAGTVTQSGNGRVMGALVTATGAPASGTLVKLFPSYYDPVVDGVIVPADTTDATGRYRFDDIDSGTYSITAVNGDSKTRAARFGITIAGDTVMVLPDTMRIPGSIRVALPGTIDPANGYLYVPGTTIYSRLGGQTGYITMDSVPAGVAMSVYYTVGNSTTIPKVIRDSATVLPGSVTTLEYVDWKYRRDLYLNTTATGAQVSATVTGFPVLVRLTSNNFIFADAGRNGDDLRFTKSDGTLLPFEIERWDSTSSLAEIWVRVDTVYGDNSSQNITMYWGNPGAKSASNGAAVFDTSASGGFGGVWHLNEPARDMAKDATGNHFDGTPSDTAPAAADGRIGAAWEFNGISSFVDIKNTANGKLNFPQDGRYSISAWVYVDTLDNGYHMIAGKGNGQYFLKQYYTQTVQPYTWEFVEYHDKSGWQITDYPATEKAWVYLTGVRDKGNQYFYVNGNLVNTAAHTNSETLARDTTQNVTIGKYAQSVTVPNEGFDPFKGIIDEVRISDVSRSAEWEKLCYMNQKTPDALVVFK